METDRQAELAFAKLTQLRSELGEDTPTLKHITYEMLRRSATLRNLVHHYRAQHVQSQTQPKGAMRPEAIPGYALAEHQNTQLSAVDDLVRKAAETGIHNLEVLEAYKKGEEGVDYVKMAPG